MALESEKVNICFSNPWLMLWGRAESLPRSYKLTLIDLPLSACGLRDASWWGKVYVPVISLYSMYDSESEAALPQPSTDWQEARICAKNGGWGTTTVPEFPWEWNRSFYGFVQPAELPSRVQECAKLVSDFEDCLSLCGLLENEQLCLTRFLQSGSKWGVWGIDFGNWAFNVVLQVQNSDTSLSTAYIPHS